ncbi:hypothetical protein ACIQXW_23415 [Lysinibacillus sp. NPDC097162]|uniref:hypothetical protein n=1 Tax=Lysinibacillus sp. NPDC097162 TaxID=3364140 RepID=UPI0038033D9B
MKRVGEALSVRSDKKRDVKPTIPMDLKDVLYRISYITFTPVKDVCQQMAMLVLHDRRTIENLSKYFKRDLIMGHTMFVGNITNKTMEKRPKVRGERVTIRFTQKEFESVALLSYALDCTPSRTVAILLDMSMKSVRFVNAYIKRYLTEELNDAQMRELQAILRYVNKVGESYFSWASLLEHVLAEVGSPVSRIKEAVSEFIDMKWRE